MSFASEDALVGEDSDYSQVYLRVRRADCGSGLPDARDTTAPVVSGARLSRRRFRVGRARTPLAARLRPGTVLRFRSSEAGTASLTFSRTPCAGGMAESKPPPRRPAHADDRRGPGRSRSSGRVGRRALRAGRYRLTLQVRDRRATSPARYGCSFRVAPLARKFIFKRGASFCGGRRFRW